MASGKKDNKTTLKECKSFEKHVLEQCRLNKQDKGDLKTKILSLQDAIQGGHLETIETCASNIMRMCTNKRVLISDNHRIWLQKMEKLCKGGEERGEGGRRGGDEESWLQKVDCTGATVPGQGGDHYNSSVARGGGIKPPVNKTVIDVSVQSLNFRGSGDSSKNSQKPEQAGRTGAPSSSHGSSYNKSASKVDTPYKGNQDVHPSRPSDADQGPDKYPDREELKQQLREKDEEINQLKKDREVLLEEKIDLAKDKEQKKEDLNVMERSYNEAMQTPKKEAEELQTAKKEAEELRNTNGIHEKEIKELKEKVQQLQSQIEKDTAEFTGHWTKAQDDIKRYKHDLKDRGNDIREKDSQIQSLKTELNDLSNRYSQLASNQLKHNNPDIVDLSDPNRAMKLADRYNGVYNDSWTDAFTAQVDLRIPERTVIQNLLHVLEESFQFCKYLAHQQFESLSHVILHPCQSQQEDLKKPVKKGAGEKQPRMNSANEKALCDLRRQIMVQNVAEITQEFLSHMSKQVRSNDEKRCMGASIPYYEKCVEISWLMVLHDPPLCLKTDVKPGSKVDTNYFSVLSKGDKAEYLVWPALLNGDGKGLLAKGVVEVQKGKK